MTAADEPEVCPRCGCMTIGSLARACTDQVKQFNAVQRGIEPTRITTKVILNDRELVRAVNKWNADRPAREAMRRSAAAALYRYRWSWWRFTFAVRR